MKPTSPPDPFPLWLTLKPWWTTKPWICQNQLAEQCAQEGFEKKSLLLSHEPKHKKMYRRNYPYSASSYAASKTVEPKLSTNLR